LLAPEDYERTIASRNAQIGDGDEGRATLDYHVITRKTHRRLKMHAVAHMVKNPYFGKIYYVILGPRGEEAD
ncbi:MAG: diguanylate cyclase, partial [Lactobacillus porci]|nr:diguanylate cyclase [Lactobacillus porci]